MTANIDHKNASDLLAEIKDKLLFINNCIFELNGYSFEDFKSLSSSFKRCYEDINTIYNNTSAAFKIALSTQKDEISEEVSAIARLSNEAVEDLQDVLKNYIARQTANNPKKNTLFLSLNNFKQDVKTFELILANINLNDNTKKAALNGKNISTDEFKSKFAEFSATINNCLTSLKNNDEAMNLVVFNEDTDNLSKLDAPIFDNNTIGSMYHQHLSLIEKGKTKLDINVDAATRSFSSIVTKLQYQDIISQSIQHMLSAHKHIIEQTESSTITNQTDVEAFLKKVKFMTLLQTGQLIQVNKDYQESIKVIVDKFDDLFSNVQALVELSDILKSKSFVSESFWYDITPHLSSLDNIIAVANRAIDVMEKAHVLAISDNGTFIEMQQSIQKFETFVAAFSEVILNDKNVREVELLETLMNNINQDTSQVHDVLASLISHTSDIITSILNEIKLGEIKQTMSLSLEKKQELNEHIEEINTTLKVDMRENVRLDSDISKNLKNAIQEIRYYAHFERTAEMIITKLEDIKKNIYIDDIDIKDIDTEEFKHFYTVKSEHLVFNSLVNSGGAVDNQAEKQDDDIELF